MPSSSTIIWSAFKIVLTLCATIITVLSLVFVAKAALNLLSVFKSNAEKLSSKTNISGSIAIALAIDKRCFRPPDTFAPPCAISDLYLSGFASINSVACAILAASFICSSDISGLPYFMFDSIVPENKSPFCGTNPILFLNSCWGTSLILTPSINSSPPVTS